MRGLPPQPRGHRYRWVHVRFFNETETCPMTQRLKALRFKAAHRQTWRCYYCDMPMWDTDLDQFVIRYRLTRRSALPMKCTAEHLIAQCEGGRDRADNIAAACLTCNKRRHSTKKPKSPHDYRCHVQGRVQKGKWHSGSVSRLAKRKCFDDEGRPKHAITSVRVRR